MGTEVTEATALGIFITGLGAGGGSEVDDPAYEPKESYEPGTFDELPEAPEAELEAEVGPLVGAEYISWP